MTPAHQILVGDCLELLRAIPDESAHCYITSPPYFGLREYGMAGGYPELLIRALNIESTAKAAGNFNSVNLRDLGRRPNRGEYIELVDEAEANDPGAFFLRQYSPKTAHKVRLLLRVDGMETSPDKLLQQIAARNEHFSSPYLIISAKGRRVGPSMLRDRWEAAREAAQQAAIEAGDPEFGTIIRNFQFKDIRPKAATEINDLKEASRLLGHTEEEITKKIYIRRGAVAKPAK
ncbi:hypothetical protein [Pseudomonas sp. NBRC 100443]|uniref:hypothetical protein n=1 Tax=Pseudomonas sp. NBRC 100443 TaxID=1113665 RepID=UPI0024A18D31|nr:hypothetical protein [Pseudomonas sp. NBRC 100443]GLU41264.1 hypothetical protein Pssp01_53570 [Pseudomonas sp. NBRC 100443]